MEIRYLKIEDFYELRNLLDGVFSRKYDRETSFEKLFPRFFTEPNEYSTIEKSQPAMFRIVNNQRLENVIGKLGLGMDDLYAPYLT